MNIQLFILSIVIIQIILMKIYQMQYFDFFSLLKNIYFGLIFLIIFFKFKKKHILWNLRKYRKKYLLLLTIPIIYIFQYMFSPTYLGQDIVALPATVPGYIFTHLDKIQTTDSIHKDYIMCHAPNLKEGGNNMWYQYTHYQTFR